MIDLNYAVYSFVAMFLIVDPIGNVPTFHSLLEMYNIENRSQMIRRAVTIATIVIILCTIGGNRVFQLLGIDLYSFRIAGGLLLFIIAIEMLFGRRTGTESTKEEKRDAMLREDIVVMPMAIPLLAGPGAITMSIVLFNQADTIIDILILLTNITLVFSISYIILTRSAVIFKLLGTTGTKVGMRLMGLLLATIAVQFVITGISEAITGAMHG